MTERDLHVAHLYKRYEEQGALSDLNEAILIGRELLELRSQVDPLRSLALANLAVCLRARFSQLGMLSDLDEALSLELDALKLRPPGHFLRAISLGNLAFVLYTRFEQLGTLSDLDDALSLERAALELRPQGHSGRANSLCNIALYLHSRFLRLGMLSDLDEAIVLERDALALRPQGHADRHLSLGNLGSLLHSRFQKLGTLSDLDEALTLERDALELRPQGNPLRASSLNNLARFLHSRFRQLGTLSDLDEALALERLALELRPAGHPSRTFSLSNLALYLHARFQQLGTLSDLDEALVLAREDLELHSQGHPDRPTSLNNIGYYLYTRFKQVGMTSDLDEALALARNVLALRPQGPLLPVFLGNAGLYLHHRFAQLGVLSDLDEALDLHRKTLELCSQKDPYRHYVLTNLADSLYARFERLGSFSNLDEALAFHHNALELRPPGHPSRADSLCSIASCHYARFKRSATHDVRDLQETFSVYSQLSDILQTVSFSRLKSVKQWIQAAEECEHSTVIQAYQTFLRLSVHYLATLPSLPQHLALFKQLTASIAVDAFSACVRHGKHADAVELLEQGRGVFWGQLLRLRSPLDQVIASGETGKKLADRFTQLASILRTVLDAPPNSEPQSQHDRVFRLNVQLQDIVSEIRKLPGLSRFLEPPLFSDLRIAAASGPVVIVNASQYSCDALVVLPNRDPVHVALSITKSRISKLCLDLRTLTSRAKSDDMTKEFCKFLRKLWDEVVFPIVQVLQEFCPHQSRIWWCPTAEFSLLPLHAAGSFRKDQPMLSDLYISSYTPTLTALVRARQTSPADSSSDQRRFLTVGQAQPPGECELVSVNTELSVISQRIGSAAILTCLQDEDATITNVAEAFKTNEFVHFACHGIADQTQPFESGFLLGDGPLKVENIMQHDLQDARFAYLSACHTTVGDKESPDEVIHLAAAMQFAGFRSVIGTMWAVDDRHTNEITSKFYEYMLDESGRLDHTRAAWALHTTIRSLPAGGIPWDQRILYIHLGV